MPGPAAPDDERYMGRALELAAGGLGRTSPNPAVGAVVVAADEIVGEGWHRRAGEPHAEPLALTAAGARARGATLYVSLEPCCHHGRTPPCTAAIIAAGIRRVLYACTDCDDRCAGQGHQALVAAGVAVAGGLLGEQARRLNEAYFKHKQSGLPYVTLKLACSLDGKTATHTGDARWISGPPARQRVHLLRDRSDAVMVGSGTVLRDDPQLTTRRESGEGRDALRVIVDSHARTPPQARVVTGGGPGCLIAVVAGAPQDRVAALRRAGAEVIVLPPAGDGRVDLRALMAELGRRNVMSILHEGGATLAGAAVAAGVVDKLVWFYAPRLIGGTAAPPVLAGEGVAAVADAATVRITALERIGDDIMVEAYPCSPD